MTDRPVCRDALAVLIAGEAADQGRVRRAMAHVAACPTCSSAVDDGGAAQRVLSTGPGSPSAVVRVALAVMATAQLVAAGPWLFGGNAAGFLGHPSGAHLARDGALGVSAGVAGLVAAWRPRAATGLRWLLAALVVVHVVAGAVDEQGGGVTLDFEAAHVLLAGIATAIAFLSVVPGSSSLRRAWRPTSVVNATASEAARPDRDAPVMAIKPGDRASRAARARRR